MKQSFVASVAVVTVVVLQLSASPVPGSSDKWAPLSAFPTGINAGVYSIVFDSSNPNIVYAALFGPEGVLKSTNGGASWTVKNKGITDLNVLRLVLDSKAPSTLYASTGNLHGIFKSDDAGENWRPINTGLDPLYNTAWSLVIDPDNSNVLYAGFGGSGVFKSTNGGQSWFSVNNGIAPDAWVYSLVIDARDSDTLYAAGYKCGGFGVAKTTNGGATWTSCGFLPEQFAGAIAMDPSSPATLYVTTQTKGIFKSVDGGDNFFPINNGLSEFVLTAGNALLMDPISPSTLYLGKASNGQAQVYRSSDGGWSWSDVSSGLPAGALYSLAIDPTFRNRVYAGVERIKGGIFNATFPNPRANITMSGSSYGINETVVATDFKITNLEATARVYLRVWLKVPGIGEVDAVAVGADGSFSLPAGLDVSVGPLNLFTVASGFPPKGNWEMNCRIADPSNGYVLAEDVNPFTIR